ncbi:Glycine/D-amino acid oxidase [Flavobacterium fryxellicola]|uniref:FAD-dependent oxidoreductase n=1 Tax=Flavobacterium fryxellicola TaxID=249352 RepID=A0A167X120_9FLAO|nr:FAD-dependent oxidoreductase [Flavobacterium fryxellicola]OAB27927.1 FAD-dependent oxidoreductase [Flavobacterium fryxellicola]SHN65677.1 Glycine/D-amino acid oxidase [Flavobacterium fryxellicola]
MIDYLIIGGGLAGISFAEKALQNDKSIFVMDNNSQNSSKIAGGLYNPVILKRFSEVWKAKEQLELMEQFYSVLEDKLKCTVDFKRPILRKFFSVEEQNNWFAASDKVALAPFLSTQLVSTKYPGIDSPYGYGEVLQTGYVDTALLIEKYKEYLIDNTLFQDEFFDYDALQLETGGIRYKDIHAKHIVFAEGFGMHSNPYFKYLPLDGTKGELFIIKAPKLDLDVIVNTSVFILPLGNDLFKVGATYNWKDKTNLPSEEGKTELIERIQEIITCDFDIIAHFAGVRPTVKDRRPLVGTLENQNAIHILNGLGTRGVMLGPAMAKELFDYIEYQAPLDPAIDIRRFKSREKK